MGLTRKIENLQLAENESVENEKRTAAEVKTEYEEKRELLKKTKIVKQTWSILDIYQKIESKDLILDPDYQRNNVWDSKKQTSFIESLYMGIMIPPIYVVEVPGNELLSVNKYEVVDGKQRLSTILSFIKGNFVLRTDSLEYYADIYSNKNFNEVYEIDREKTNEMLSSVLDIYVITSNSPEFTKYDIFARLNKGSEPLRVNEIRRAIYRSSVTDNVNVFIENEKGKPEYQQLFTEMTMKRYEDYGRFYKSIAFYTQSDLKELCVKNYNSRPRDMINNVLQKFQKEKSEMGQEEINLILFKTIKLLTLLNDFKGKDYIIDACIPFIETKWEEIISKLEEIKMDSEIEETLIKSPATTSNVNKRLRRINEIIGD